ncbi:TadG family pilus assembly protein [Fontivita pretiosa]|uniref:TadG family pilus assembly protein n=1 Tax=Fontivita pretiosa TaxID=2989684 RepID=UPI003D16A864
MRKTGHRGVSTIYAVIALVVFCAFCSLGVDLGRVQLARSELQAAADAAARHAATGLADGTALAKARAAASDNKVDGQTVAIQPGDVLLGNWDAALTPRFSSARTPLNAVQVSLARSHANGNPIPLLFAAILGQESCDVRVSAIATVAPALPKGFIGLNGVTVKNNLISAGYNSSVNTVPALSYRAAGMVGSNVSITAAQNEVAGLVVLGPSASHNLNLADPPLRIDEPILTPMLDFAAAPAANPSGVPKDLTVSGNTVLPGGTYHFNSITLRNNASLSFSAPATLYIDGNVTFLQSGHITAYGSVPANLRIFQRGAGTIFGGSTANNIDVCAVIEAPQTAFIGWNGASLKGAATFLSIEAKNNLELYYDESLHRTLDGSDPSRVALVK